MNKATKAEDLAKNVIEKPSMLAGIFDGISSDNARTKIKSAKTLRIISEKKPTMLYSRMDFFIKLLDSKNNILKWITIDIIGNLASVDSEKKFDKLFNKYYGLLTDESMITIGHVIDNSGRIAKAKPHITQEITSILLKTENIPITPHITQECKNILFGKAIQAFSEFFDQIKNKDAVISFVRTHLNSTRNATKIKAEKFLARYA
jgi:hypothetical protein